MRGTLFLKRISKFAAPNHRIMNRLIPFFLLAATLLCACNKDVTFAELRANERKQIRSFIANGCKVVDPDSKDVLLEVKAPITTISEPELIAKIKAARERGEVFHQDENEYTYLEDLELYMHIVSLGTGNMGKTRTEIVDGVEKEVPVLGDTLAMGTTRRVFVRYIEYNIAGDSIQTSNLLSPSYAQLPEEMSVSNNEGSITGTFLGGVMMSYYSNNSVPNGWLYPLYYVCLGRMVNDTDELAKVRLIVPSSEGQQDASDRTYPCFYELTYQSAR